jgi:predicted secreted Zn-dependent protease
MIPTTMVWRRSTFCANGTCVEVAFDGDEVAVRDGKNPEQNAIRVTRAQWNDFVRGVQAREFDRF